MSIHLGRQGSEGPRGSVWKVRATQSESEGPENHSSAHTNATPVTTHLLLC